MNIDKEQFNPTEINDQEDNEIDQKLEPNKTSGLFDIIENDDGTFTINLPGLIDTENGNIVGYSQRECATREEAEAAVSESQKDIETMREQLAMEKTYGAYVYRIEKLADDKFKVFIPGLKDLKTGNFVGSTDVEFDNWEAARDFLQEQRQEFEKLSENVLLELELGDAAKISYSDFDAFKPVVNPTQETFPIPEEVQKYIIKQEKLAGSDESASTYQETIKDPYWELKIFNFVKDYLSKEGANIAKELGIKKLDLLDPRQAIELSSRIVVELTKYNYGQINNSRDYEKNKEKSRSDESSALDLLIEGRRKKKNPDWEGNGVCRNFASMEKAVFEALKKRQNQYSKLNNTYALYETGNREDYTLKKEDFKKTNFDRGGHAWNTFVTINKEGEANATIVDTTWAKMNLATGKMEGLDYTMTRMEPIVHGMAKEILSNDKENNKDSSDKLKSVLSYYSLKYDRANANPNTSVSENEKKYLAKRTLDLVGTSTVKEKLPVEIINILTIEYSGSLDLVDPSEIENLWEVAKQNPELPINKILDKYVKKDDIFGYPGNNLMVNNPELQRALIERIKGEKEYEKLVTENASFRSKVRDCFPEILPDFEPDIRTADAQELRLIVSSSQHLRNFEMMVDPRKPNPEKIAKIFLKAREILKDLDADKYDAEVSSLDNYHMVRNFENLHRQFSKK